MRQQTETLQIRITPEMIRYLRILSEKYYIQRSEFIRSAITEKLKRDVPKLRAEKKKEYVPF